MPLPRAVFVEEQACRPPSRSPPSSTTSDPKTTRRTVASSLPIPRHDQKITGAATAIKAKLPLAREKLDANSVNFPGSSNKAQASPQQPKGLIAKRRLPAPLKAAASEPSSPLAKKTKTIMEGKTVDAGGQVRAPAWGSSKTAYKDHGPWRTTASADVESLGLAFGHDLVRVPPAWQDPEECRRTLSESPLLVPAVDAGGHLFAKSLAFDETVDFVSLYPGIANLELAMLNSSLQVGLWTDIAPHPHLSDIKPMNLLEEDARKLVWAFIITFKPKWVHSGFPCTFWSPLSRWCNRRTGDQDECLRRQSLVHIRFTQQVLEFQASQGLRASYENPRRCCSHRLDILADLRATHQMSMTTSPTCSWGARDPESGLPYKKEMTFVTNFPLSFMYRKCECRAPRPGMSPHQIVKGRLSNGECRSVLSGQYPRLLCTAFAEEFRSFLGK